jgi:hypothetical protein
MAAFLTARRAAAVLGLSSIASCSAQGAGSPPDLSPGGGGQQTTAGTGPAGAGGTTPTGGVAAVTGGAGATQVGAGQGTGGASAGAAGGGAGGTGPSNGEPCEGASILCSDFEAAAIPTELLFWPEHLRAMQGSFVALDASIAHSGQQSLKVTGTDFSQMLGVAVPSQFWGRVYLRSDTDIQQGHNTYVAAGTGTGDPNNGTYIRIGEHQCQLELNRSTDDKELLSNGGTYACEGGTKLLKDTWYCLEFSYDGPGQEIRVFVDGAEVSALHSTDWGSYDYKIFKLGFEKYHGDNKTLWYDDLALGPARLNCD